MTDQANIVVLRAQVGKSSLLGEALSELVVLTSQEPGCAVCELNQSVDDPNTWMVYERWKGEEAFARHMNQPYVAKFLGRVDELTSEPPQVQPFSFRGRS